MVEVITFGCRINAYESEVLKEKLAALDNLVIINTCAVTGEAERQCRQAIRKLHREKPNVRIIVTGCAAQIAPQKFAAMPEVDLVLGNKEKVDIEQFLASSQRNVSGTVIVRLRPLGYTLVGVDSPLDLMKTDFGEYGEVNRAWTADDVKGFTKILANPLKIYYNVQKRNGAKL